MCYVCLFELVLKVPVAKVMSGHCLHFMGLLPKMRNLNGLLVTRQTGNTSPGGGGGGGGGGHFSRGDKRIRKVIPVPDSLWKETTFVRFFAS